MALRRAKLMPHAARGASGDSAPACAGTMAAAAKRRGTRAASDWLHQSPIATMKFQDSLLRLPVPTLEETCSKYLSFVQPLIKPEAYAHTAGVVKQFQLNAATGPALQAHLTSWAKGHKHTSYIAEMWYSMYLKDRSPLPLNLNPQLTWRDDPRPGAMEQGMRAAMLVHAAVRFHLTLAAGVLQPDVFHTKPHISQHPAFAWAVGNLVPTALACYPMYAAGAYPLDMSQYHRLFASTRVPVKAGEDELVTAGDRGGSTPKASVRHIIVQRGPRLYAVDVLDPSGGVVPESTLQARFASILSDSAGARGWDTSGQDGVEPGRAGKGAGYAQEPPVGALTGTYRDDWADARAALQRLSPTNAAHLKAIDEGLFTLTLDDARPTTHAEVSRVMLHGDGRNRWFDKCLNLIVAANGKAGVSWEHAWGDGAAVLYFFNTLFKEVSKRHVPQPGAQAHGTGQGKGGAGAGLGDGVRPLRFDLDGPSGPVVQAIRAAERRFDTAIAATRLRVYGSPALTKEDVKRSKLSPDGVMQAVLQLAHWRAHGYTPVTYESASTAAFKHGRTETIRSATAQSAAMCVAFAGRVGQGTHGSIPAVPDTAALVHDPAGRYAALKASADRHRAITLAAVMGKGVDRHLFALSTWAGRLSMPTPPIFTDPAWAHFKDIRLSTSTLESDALDGGGFGPVSGTSYAVGYGIEERGAHFHVMSYDPAAAGAVFPGTADASTGTASTAAATNPASNGYAPVDNAAFVSALEQALVDVQEAITKGGPAGGASGGAK